MRCFYCGKRVSLVRKRIDADFCSDEHREKYHARTRRTMEALVEDEERMLVTRRLNEGFPIRSAAPFQGTDLDDLVIRSVGRLLHFTWMPAGLPISRPRLQTTIAPATIFVFHTARHNEPASPPRAEPARWSFPAAGHAPRPPRPVGVSIQLPAAGLRRMASAGSAVGLPARNNAPLPAVELGARLVRIAVLQPDMAPASRSISARARREWMYAFDPPAPVPPPARQPILAALRHPRTSARLDSLHLHVGPSGRIPIPGRVGMKDSPGRSVVRPPAAPWEIIERVELRLQPVSIETAAVRPAHESKGIERLVPCPEGFRRKQYYSWEPLDRLCAVGFATVANHRPEIRIVAAPAEASNPRGACLLVAASNDPETAQPDPRHPAPPFRERLALPRTPAVWHSADLRDAAAATLPLKNLDLGTRLPRLWQWQFVDGFPPLPGAAASSPILSGEWASGTAEAIAITAWIRPQSCTAKRTACQSSIPAAAPAFSGPEFIAGRRQAGPMPQKPLQPPRFVPAAAMRRPERVETARRTLLPASRKQIAGLREGGIPAESRRPPVATAVSRSSAHPVFPILIGTSLPSGHLRPESAAGLRVHVCARRQGSIFDIAPGKRRVECQPLDRFRRRGYDALHSTPTCPIWPARSSPGLLPPLASAPLPHPPREPVYANAETMFRACGRPAANAFWRTCTLMDWGTLAPGVLSGADWGKEAHPAEIPLALGIVLPVDPHGTIRDWGLTPVSEPEEPPEPIHEDFALGLSNWICSNSDWRQDIAGVRTGSLALLRPSLGMRDYELEFLGKIENHSIGWVYRACTTETYHAARIALDASGKATLLRFSVLAGDRNEPIAEPIPVALARSASCRVKMTASGDEFKLFINDKPVSEWIDDRLPDGGIGFFSEADDRARLYWVKVTPCGGGPAEDLSPPVHPLRHQLHREVRMGV